MNTSSLDLLEKTQLPPAQARAILQVMESELATKADLLLLATKTDLSAVRSELRDDIHALELKLEAQRGETRTEFQSVRAEIQTLRADMIREIKGTVRWNFAFWVTQLAAMAAILRLLK